MRGLVILAAAIAACGLVVRYGPLAAEQLLAFSGEPERTDAAVETLFTLTIFGALLLVAVAGSAWARLNPFRLGERPAAMLALGALVGAAGIIAAVLLAKLAGSLGAGSSPSGGTPTILWGSAMILSAAAAEEVYFRGWLQPALARHHGVPLAVLFSSLAFAGLHLMGGARSPATLVNLFLGGLLFGLLAARGGGLAGAVAAHFAWNWTEQIGLGLDPNPGIGSFGALADLELTGAALWGGSDEGLNASIAMTVALLALVVPLAILTRGHLLRVPDGSAAAAAE